MWLPNEAVSYLLAALSCVCWGSFSSTMTVASLKKHPWQLWTLDFCVGMVVFCTVSALTLGTFGSADTQGETTFAGSLAAAAPAKCVLAFVAGLVWGVANMLLLVGIELSGVAVVFPVLVGTGLAGGTTLTYVIERAGDPALLFAGVALSIVAVGCMARAHGIREAALAEKARYERASSRSALELSGVGIGSGAPVLDGPAPFDDDDDEEEFNDVIDLDEALERGVPERTETASPAAPVSAAAPVPAPAPAPAAVPVKASPLSLADAEDAAAEAAARAKMRETVVIGLAGGVFLTGWAPLMAMAQRGDDHLSPYAAFWLFTMGGVVSHVLCNAYVMRNPHGSGEKMTEAAWLAPGTPFTTHLWGVLGAVVWGVGTQANIIAGGQIGFAASFALGSSAPLVGSLWGLFYWREFDGAPALALRFISLVFVFYFAGIACVALA